MQQLSQSANPETQVNENFNSLDHQAVYGKRHPVTTGLVWGYYGGRWGGLSIADGTLTLTASATNYVVVQRSDGAISVSTATTNWDNAGAYARVYKLTLTGSVVSTTEDHRAGPFGVHGFGPGVVLRGAGTPEGVVTAPVGVMFQRSDGGAGTSLYVKESGAGNTGWASK
jgi:hypothetical protein